MNERYQMLLDLGLRKFTRDTGQDARFVVIDEYAYFSATVGTKAQQAEFAALSRDLVARGRAAAPPVGPGDPAPLSPGHRSFAPRLVRLPVGVPLHYRFVL